jgi:hypothetical protein
MPEQDLSLQPTFILGRVLSIPTNGAGKSRGFLPGCRTFDVWSCDMNVTPRTWDAPSSVVDWPNSGLPRVLLGLPKFGWLRTLNNSPRNETPPSRGFVIASATQNQLARGKRNIGKNRPLCDMVFAQESSRCVRTIHFESVRFCCCIAELTQYRGTSRPGKAVRDRTSVHAFFLQGSQSSRLGSSG